MKNFSDFGIEPETKHFVGDKIKIDRILNREIIVHDYDVKMSKLPGKENTQCLYLQIELNGEKQVLFSGSKVLIDMIERVPEDDFPFTATIEKKDQRLVFK